MTKIDINTENVAVTVEEPKTMFRFVGNRFTLNVHHLAYILSMIGVNIPAEVYETTPDDIKKHFVEVKV